MNNYNILNLSKKQLGKKLENPKDELCKLISEIIYPDKEFKHNLRIPDNQELTGSSQPYECTKCGTDWFAAPKKPDGICEVSDPIDINISELAFLLKHKTKDLKIWNSIKKVMDKSFKDEYDDFNYSLYWGNEADEICWIQACIWAYIFKKEENDGKN